MKCPKCGSKNITKAGKNYYRNKETQRFICKDCRHITVNPLRDESDAIQH